MSLQAHGRILRTAVVLALCGLFFLLAMGLTLLASGAYRGIVAESDNTYSRRTALSYLVNQVRRNDISGAVSVRAFGDGDAICLEEDGYTTLLYCYDGQLRELYAEETLTFAPEDGTALLPLDDLTVALEDGFLTITTTSGDIISSTSCCLRSGPEEVAA